MQMGNRIDRTHLLGYKKHCPFSRNVSQMGEQLPFPSNIETTTESVFLTVGYTVNLDHTGWSWAHMQRPIVGSYGVADLMLE